MNTAKLIYKVDLLSQRVAGFPVGVSTARLTKAHKDLTSLRDEVKGLGAGEVRTLCLDSLVTAALSLANKIIPPTDSVVEA